jgi:transposase
MDTPAPDRKFRRTWRSFSEEFKTAAVKLVMDEGKTLTAVSRELGLSKSMLHTWVTHARAHQRAAMTTAERDILRRAVALFAKHP